MRVKAISTIHGKWNGLICKMVISGKKEEIYAVLIWILKQAGENTESYKDESLDVIIEKITEVYRNEDESLSDLFDPIDDYTFTIQYEPQSGLFSLVIYTLLNSDYNDLRDEMPVLSRIPESFPDIGVYFMATDALVPYHGPYLMDSPVWKEITLVSGRITEIEDVDYKTGTLFNYILFVRFYNNYNISAVPKEVLFIKDLNDSLEITENTKRDLSEALNKNNGTDLKLAVAKNTALCLHEGIENEIAVLKEMFSDRLYKNDRMSYPGKLTDPAFADTVFANAQDSKDRAMAAFFRLTHDEDLPEGLRKQYLTVVRRSRNTVYNKVKYLNDQYLLRFMLDNDLITPKQIRTLKSEWGTVDTPEWVESIIRDYEAGATGKQVAQKTTEPDIFKRVELISLLETNEMMHIKNDVDDAVIILKKDGTVISQYAETKHWKDIVQVFTVCGLLGAVVKDGSVVSFDPVKTEWSKAFAADFSAWNNVRRIFVRNHSKDLLRSVYHGEDAFCVGIGVDGRVLKCGKSIQNDRQVSTVSNAKDVIICKNSYAVICDDGSVISAGRKTVPLSDIADADYQETEDPVYSGLHWPNRPEYLHIIYFKDGTSMFFDKVMHEKSDDKKAIVLDDRIMLRNKRICSVEEDRVWKKDDQLFVGNDAIRFDKYSKSDPVSDFCTLSDYSSRRFVVAVLYESGNIRLFDGDNYNGKIVAKNAGKIEVEDGTVYAYIR